MCRRVGAAFGAIGVGIAAAVFGLMPWLISGIRLPGQNLWADGTLSDDMPYALLPFSQYYILMLFGMIVLPGGIVGVGLRFWFHSRRGGQEPRWRAPLLAVVGLLIVQITRHPGLYPPDCDLERRRSFMSGKSTLLL